VSGPRVVALGGGHGLAASLRALRLVTDDVTAIVTVADDGGSSGRLRRQFPHQLPPGDLRMALTALAATADDGALWGDVFQHRFPGDGELGGHPVGNVVLAGLADVLGDPVAALDAAARLLGVTGRVLPMADVPVDIVADVVGLDPDDQLAPTEVVGQVAVATTRGQVVGVRLTPPEPPACRAAVAAVEAADWVVFGPGSWFTSVLPHVLVPDLEKALVATATHLEVLAAHAPGLSVDVVLANDETSPDRAGLADAARTLGADVVFGSVARDDGTPRHDPTRLAGLLDEIFARKGGRRPWR
jgi:uncharacterized cofD-like protein